MGTPKMCKACYQCIYRGTVPGSAHSSCNHPAAQIVKEKAPHAELLGMLGMGVNLTIKATPSETGIEEQMVTGSPHGIAKGWFSWPFNFDPVWLEDCKLYTPKEIAQAHVGGE